jgi:hypothetical protein
MSKKQETFHINKESVEILERLEELNDKFNNMISRLRLAEKIITGINKELSFEKVRVNERIRK